MRNKQSGLTLLEILIAMAILGIIMAMNSTLLQEMIRGTKQQSSIVTSQFETGLGLEIFRNDLGNAGYGLPDAFLNKTTETVTYTHPDTAKYIEPTGNPAQQFNDSPSIPRSIVHLNDVSTYDATYLANSDYLVIKSPAVGMNNAANKWTYVINDTAPVHVWGDSSLDMETGDYMIVIRPRVKMGDTAQLIIKTNGDYSLTHAGSASLSDTYFQAPTGERYIAYGVSNDTTLANLRMPFNRADYYVRRTTTGTTSAGCAPGTGTLFKAVANQGGGGFTTYPIMDCVANMQVVFRLDTNTDGFPDQTVNILAGKTAMEIKEQVKEIRVYILAHEGTFDKGYRYSGSSTVNPVPAPDSALGQSVNMTNFQDASHPWDRYRWKTYTLSVKPRSFY